MPKAKRRILKGRCLTKATGKLREYGFLNEAIIPILKDLDFGTHLISLLMLTRDAGNSEIAVCSGL